MENKVNKSIEKEDKIQPIFLGVKILKRTNEFNYFNYRKKFMLAFSSHATEYTKTDTKYGAHIEIVPNIHSLPWEKLYFYLTETEYNFIRNSFKTATVEGVSISIFNAGASKTERGTNQKLGIWTELKRNELTEFGTNITPKVLYGLDISTLPSTSYPIDIPVDYVGANGEMKIVDNRIHYRINIKRSENGEDRPDLFLQDMILSPGVNSGIGRLDKIVYIPKYGQFHDVTYVPDKRFLITGHNGVSTTSRTVFNSYEDTTIENQMDDFLDGIGVGLFPRNPIDGPIEDAGMELWIQTDIRIRVEGLREC